MRCLSRGCNNRLSDFELTRRWAEDGSYIDACVFCVPVDSTTQLTKPGLRAPQRDEPFNNNDGDDLPYKRDTVLDIEGEPWYFNDEEGDDV